MVRFGGISGEFGRAMVRILARRSPAKIPMARPNEPDRPGEWGRGKGEGGRGKGEGGRGKGEGGRGKGEGGRGKGEWEIENRKFENGKFKMKNW